MVNLRKKVALGAAEEADEEGHGDVGGGVVEDVQGDRGVGIAFAGGVDRLLDLGPEEGGDEHFVADAGDVDLDAQLADIGVGEDSGDVGDHGAILRRRDAGPGRG